MSSLVFSYDVVCQHNPFACLEFDGIILVKFEGESIGLRNRDGGIVNVEDVCLVGSFHSYDTLDFRYGGAYFRPHLSVE